MFSSTLRKTRWSSKSPELGMSSGGPTSTQGSGSSWTSPVCSQFPGTSESVLRYRGQRSLQAKVGKKNHFLVYCFHVLNQPHVGWAQGTSVDRAPQRHSGSQSRRWDSTRTRSSACWGLSQPTKAGSQCWVPPKPPPYLRSVLSAREMAGFLTALLQAALLLRGKKQPQRGFWRHFNAAMSNPHPRAKLWSRYCCNEPPGCTGIEGGGRNCLYLLPGSRAQICITQI